MKIVWHVTGDQIKRKVEVDNQQHLYYATNNAGYVLVYTKAFIKGPCFILWYDGYYPTFAENFLGNF